VLTKSYYMTRLLGESSLRLRDSSACLNEHSGPGLAHAGCSAPLIPVQPSPAPWPANALGLLPQAAFLGIGMLYSELDILFRVIGLFDSATGTRVSAS
jgi:hypothetical protein